MTTMKIVGKSDEWAPPIPDDIWDGRTGRGVRVAVIDSGVDTDHPSLQGKVKGAVEAHAQNGQINFRRSTTGDSAGHGTACAGIITTIAPDVELYSIKVLGAKASGTGDVFLSGFEYAIKQRMQIINLSLGTTKRELFGPLHDLLDKAYQLGCIVVAAANNLPQPSFPSIFSSSVVSVIKKEGTDPFSFGYRYGEVIEISAPGVGVRAAWPGGGYRTLTGNSFACPHVVGLIALLLEAYPDLTPFQVKTILHAVARKNQKETTL